ncbi:MAG: leucine-rich repeat protein [Christensenellales bacterium]
MSNKGTVRRKMGILLVLALAVVLWLGLVGNAGAETTGTTPEGFTYSVANKEATITGYSGPGGLLRLPNTIGGCSVTSVGASAFQNIPSITGVVFPEGLKSIQANAFAACTNLEYLKFATTIETIGVSAFSTCIKLNNAFLPPKLDAVESGTFSGCTNLTSVNLPSTIARIEDSAFKGCNISSIALPEGLEYLSGSAFINCNNIYTMSIPSKVAIDSNLFWDINNLQSINVDAANLNYSSIDGVLYNKDKTILLCYPSNKAGSSFSVPAGVTTISSMAFREIKHLYYVSLPDGFKNLESSAFSTSRAVSGIQEITIPKSVSRIPAWSLKWAWNLRKVTIYSRDCLIENDSIYDSFSEVTIYGYAGSTAEKYARDNSLHFVALAVVPTTSISLNKASMLLSVGETDRVGYSFEPANAYPNLVWTSSNPDIVMVLASGDLLAVTPGTATITAAEKDNTSVNASCTVTVKALAYDMLSARWGYTAPFTYDGAEKSVQVTGLPAGVTPIYTGNTATNAGEYTAKISFTYDTANYEQPVMADLNWSIGKAVYDMSAVKWDYAAPFTFDGAAKTVALTGLPESVKPVYTNNIATNAGTHTASVALTSQDPNYDSPVMADLNWSIGKGAFDMSGVKWDYAAPFTYDGAAKTVALSGLPASVTPVYTNNTATSAGTYTASVVLTSEDPNYLSPVMADLSWVIGKASYDLSLAKWNYVAPFTYDGTPKSVEVTGPPAGITVASYTGNTGTEVGNYTASVIFTYDAVNYEQPVLAPLAWAITAPAAVALPGDANDDKEIDLEDLVALIDYLVSGKVPKSMENANADGSADGVIDLQDLVWIIDKIVGV